MTEKEIVYQESDCYEFDLSNRQPYLIGSKCQRCGYITFPPRIVCSACVSKGGMERVALGSRGKIDTFSVLHVGTPDFKAPYILAYVMIGGTKVLSMITGCEAREEALEIGEEVDLVIEKIREDEEGHEIWGYKFRPVRREERGR